MNYADPRFWTRRGRVLFSAGIAVLILVITTSYIGLAEGKNSNLQEHMDKGDSLFDQGRYEEAITYYDEALFIDPNDVSALNNKGFALDNLGRHEEAISYYDKVLEINSTDVDALNNKGVALDNLGRYEEAITYYDKALNVDPKYVAALGNKGFDLDTLGRYQEAISYYDKVLEINSTDVGSLNGKGIALGNLGRYQEAISYYDKVLAIDPTYADALTNKGNVLLKMGNSQEAIDNYDKANDLLKSESIVYNDEEDDSKFQFSDEIWPLRQIVPIVYFQTVEMGKYMPITTSQTDLVNSSSNTTRYDITSANTGNFKDEVLVNNLNRAIALENSSAPDAYKWIQRVINDAPSYCPAIYHMHIVLTNLNNVSGAMIYDEKRLTCTGYNGEPVDLHASQNVAAQNVAAQNKGRSLETGGFTLAIKQFIEVTVSNQPESKDRR